MGFSSGVVGLSQGGVVICRLLTCRDLAAKSSLFAKRVDSQSIFEATSAGYGPVREG